MASQDYQYGEARRKKTFNDNIHGVYDNIAVLFNPRLGMQQQAQPTSLRPCSIAPLAAAGCPACRAHHLAQGCSRYHRHS
jgi:hypothetical protein